MPVDLLAARKEKREEFLENFSVAKLPHPKNFMAFLSLHDLSCFVRKNVAMQRIFMEEASIVRQIIFCLPMSENITDDCIESLAKLMRQSTYQIRLYWSKCLPNVNVALRIDIQRVGKTAHIISNILYPRNIDSDQMLVAAFVNQLRANLLGYIEVDWISSKKTMETQAVRRIGDEVYWAALSLFLDLSQADESYQQKFMHWQAKQQTNLQRAQQEAMRLLSLVTYFYPPLYYGEQGRLIFGMPLIQQRLSYPRLLMQQRLDYFCLPVWVNRFPIPLETALHCLVLAGLIYYGDYFILAHLLLIHGLNKLRVRLTNTVDDGFAKITLFYLCQLFIIASRMAFDFYMALPETAIQRSIVAPRYIFSWTTVMAQEGMKLLIKSLGLASFYCAMNACLSQAVLADSENKAGFFAIAVLLLERMMLLFDAYLFRFTGWQASQFAEEGVLNFLKYLCQYHHCILDIETSLLRRVSQQALFSQETLQITATRTDGMRSLGCDFNISTSINNTVTVQSNCFARFFSHTWQRLAPNKGQTIEIFTPQPEIKLVKL